MDEKPSRNEDEYFAKHNAALIKELREKADAERARAAAEQKPMTCPRCGGTLREAAMDGVVVDVCSQCQGMWLDAGELEIIRESRGGRTFFDSFFGGRGR